MKTTHNITALQEEELDNVQGGMALALAGIIALGTTMIGTSTGLLTKMGIDMYKDSKKKNDAE